MEQKKTFLKDLSVSQLDWLLRNNNDFNDVVTEDYIESVMSWIGEEMNTFKDTLSNWEIGFYNQNFIRIKDDLGFIYAYEDFSKWYGVSDETQELLDEALQVAKAYENTEEENTIEKVEEYAEKLRIELLNYFNGCTEIKHEYLKEQLSIMLDNEQFEGYYILGNDLLKVYIDISYTKTLK